MQVKLEEITKAVNEIGNVSNWLDRRRPWQRIKLVGMALACYPMQHVTITYDGGTLVKGWWCWTRKVLYVTKVKEAKK